LEINRWDSKLALGLAVKTFQFSFNGNDLVLYDPDDDAVTYTKESAIIPDADFGALLYSNDYFVGLSIAQLFQWEISLGSYNWETNKMVRHYFINGGYNLRVNDNMEIQPSLFLRSTEQSPTQFDINIKGMYKNMYWLGISYRNANSVVALLGIKIDKYLLGYSYDCTFSNLINYSTGSHEIVIGYNFREGMNRGSALF